MSEVPEFYSDMFEIVGGPFGIVINFRKGPAEPRMETRETAARIRMSWEHASCHDLPYVASDQKYREQHRRLLPFIVKSPFRHEYRMGGLGKVLEFSSHTLNNRSVYSDGGSFHGIGSFTVLL